MLKRLTTYVSPEQYDENDPHLVKTDDPGTTDRVFVASYQGLDQVRYFENNDFSGNLRMYILMRIQLVKTIPMEIVA